MKLRFENLLVNMFWQNFHVIAFDSNQETANFYSKKKKTFVTLNLLPYSLKGTKILLVNILIKFIA